jgi:hypothetical protein
MGRSIGARAQKILFVPDLSGRVLAVVTDAVYLQANPHPVPPPTRSGEGELVWLAQNHLPMHTRALRGDFDFSVLRVGMTFHSDGACLHFGGVGVHGILSEVEGTPLQFADARVWRPAAIEPVRLAPREMVIARARTVDLTGFARPMRSLDDARDLIGLGDGLTPSGDDFVGGWLFAAHHLHAAYPGAFRWEQAAIDDLLEYARARTNTLSYALLCDHARGQGVEPLHDLVAALLQGTSRREIETHAKRLRTIGNTTGETLLAGAVMAILSLATERGNDGQ